MPCPHYTCSSPWNWHDLEHAPLEPYHTAKAALSVLGEVALAVACVGCLAQEDAVFLFLERYPLNKAFLQRFATPPMLHGQLEHAVVQNIA